MEQVNELIKKIEVLSEAEIELEQVKLFNKNLDTLKNLFGEIEKKNKETQDFINNLDVGQIVESSMEYLADEFYEKFVPPMKTLDNLVKDTKKTEIAKDLEELRLTLRQRIIDAQKVFEGTIGKTPYKLEQMETLVYMRKKLVPKLEEITEKINKNVEGISDEIKTELASNYKMLLDSLNKLKGEIKSAQDEVERLASTSAWIKEQLAQREKELAEKDKEAEAAKAELAMREKELQTVKNELEKELEQRAEESKKIQESLEAREAELEALKTETSLSKAELKKRQAALEKEIANTKEELDAKAAESETIKSQLVDREKELSSVIEETKKELEEKAVVEATKEELLKIIEEKEKDLQEMKSEMTTIRGQLTGVEGDLSQKTKEIQDKEALLSKKDKEIETLKAKAGLEEETKKLKSEIEEILQFLEKSPKYQLLYIINNEGETTLSKVEELYKIDETVIKALLEDLSQKGMISVKQEKDDFVLKIEQKLNPLSYIEMEDLFESKMYSELKEIKDMDSVNKYFDKCVDQINKHLQVNKQEAGFLLSLLYLYIYKSRNFELFNKIRSLYSQLKPESFYLKLIENALTYDPWESKKSAVLENLMEMPKLNILNTEYVTLNPTDEAYPKNGPFSIKKYKSLTLIDWEEETITEKSKLNNFTDVLNIAKWVWLNGRGANFQVELVDSNGKKHEIIVSASKKIDAHLIIKNNELIAS